MYTALCLVLHFNDNQRKGANQSAGYDPLMMCGLCNVAGRCNVGGRWIVDGTFGHLLSDCSLGSTKVGVSDSMDWLLVVSILVNG